VSTVPAPPPIARRHRLDTGALGVATALACCAVGAVGLGAVAGVPAGEGTPCPFRAVTGLPCPFCGMTHALMAFGQGDAAEAFARSPAAAVALAAAVVVLVRSPARLLRRRELTWHPVVTWLVAGAVLAGWAAKLGGMLPGA